MLQKVSNRAGSSLRVENLYSSISGSGTNTIYIVVTGEATIAGAVLPAAAIMHEVRLVPTPLITEDSPELNEDIGGGLATPESLIDGERHYSAVLPADILHEERLVSTPMVTEESPLANEDVAGSIATLTNHIQRVKSLPDLQEPAELTQASLDNAISPPDASDPIQPAIIPQKKLGRKLLKTEAVTPSWNRPKNHSREKNQRPGRLLFHSQDWLEGKSAEPELPKFRKAASASNSPAALSWNQSITLPKPSPPADLEVIRKYTASSSSRRWDRNNGSREADVYQIRDPPPGSHQDDVTGPSPKALLMAVMGVKSAVNHFAKVLITNMNKHPVELESLKRTILREVRADVDRANHWKFLVQAFICKRLFDGFDPRTGYFGVDYFKMDRMTANVSFADFSKFKDTEATISLLLDSDSPDDSFLGRFCFKKFKSISGVLASNQPLPIYQEEWDAVERECHPKTVFYQSFLKVAVSVWLVHRLVLSFEEMVEMLIYEKGAKFQRRTMESVVPGSYEEEDEEADVNTEVGFSVIPGFQVSRSVVKCEVYLRSRNRHTDMEITGRTSTEKTPVKTPVKSALKSLSGKTSVKLHSETPELPVSDSHNPGSLQSPEGFGSSSHYVDHYPPTRVGDDGSSGLVVREASMFWDALREGLIPANEGSVSRSGTIVYKMAAPPARSSNLRALIMLFRDTKVSEMRRLTNTRRSFPSV